MTTWNSTREAATQDVRESRRRAGTTWAEIAEHVDRPLLWTVAALLGSHPVPADVAVEAVRLLLEGDDGVLVEVEQPADRLNGDSLRADPTIYRFYELLDVYGPALKEAIHEEFGDGIMSAINCNVEISRRVDPEGDRVRVVIDGKFLKYQW